MGSRLSTFRVALKRIFSEPLPAAALGRRTSRVVAQQLERGMRMLSIALISQGVGAALIIAFLWGTGAHALLVAWGVIVVLSLVFSVEYYHLFLSDKDRVARIRGWLRVAIAHSMVTGAVWGSAGVFFPFLGSGVGFVSASVSAVIAVILGSWPFYAMWLPALSIFLLLSLLPTAASVLLNYLDSYQWIAVLFFVAVFFVALFSGRRLHDVTLSSILTENENRRLLQSLARERNAAEAGRRELEETSRRRQQFFRAANHDLRQPLQAMAIYLQVLKRKANPEITPAVTQIEACAKTISSLVEQILEVSRVRADTLTVRRELVPVPEYFESLRKQCAPMVEERGGTFVIRPLDYQIDTDPALLARVIRNLVANACKYSDKAHPIVILAARRRAKGLVQVCVYDNGPGIPREEREKIFAPFFRGTTGRDASGFGLGLTIVKGLCERLGIGLSVGSLPGKGTVFRLQLGAQALSEPVALSRGGEAAVSTPLKVRPLSARILYLEDNATVAQSVRVLLESWGAKIRSAPFLSDKVVEEMKAFRPQVLLTDFAFGEGAPDGVDAILRLSHELRTVIPAVFLTAAPEDAIERAWQKRLPTRALAEMPEILRKPVGEADLNSALLRALDSGKADLLLR
ncbi:MAG: hybrid sensor histidine kinase/response regulator [Sutterellaceae bacterium]|nr:hybrid sensor histidine kinase/response regulator [Sutterellaceae bacterium]MDY2867567.1 hybrid sensor histidine kinase/response regulator [Mesosutterella sp.]